ncbi:hypothetical protein DRN69_06405 [Candidatus Pacearchaeota archaeon]|nr:MAG: hypothetical protein DRN69_06405 [Candidatus Pacearchaeota archaeon]
MNLRNNKFVQLLSVNLKAIYRQRMVLFFTLLFPLIFIGVFGLSYGGDGSTTRTMDLIVINNDLGIPENTVAFYGNETVSGTFYSEKYLELLGNLVYPDSKDNKSVFSITVINETERDNAMFKLERREIVALLTLPEDFSLGILFSFRTQFSNNSFFSLLTNNWSGYPENSLSVEITVLGDSSTEEFAIAGPIINEFSKMFFQLGNEQQTGVNVNIIGNYQTKGFSTFYYIVPGVIIFGVLQSLTSGASRTMRDVDSKNLERIRLTRVASYTYVSALIVSQTLLVAIQVPIMFVTAMLFGLELSVHVLSGIIVGIILSFATTGIAFLLAGLVRKGDEAEGLANLITVPMAFLSGSFTVMPNPEIISNIGWLGGNSLRLFDFLPSTPAVRILRSLILGQRTLGENWFDLCLLIMLAIIYLGLGLGVYIQKHLRMK